MKILGVTGRSGSGKGYICEKMKKLGIPSLDTDIVCRLVYEKGQDCYNELVENFGSGILSGTLEIDRDALRMKCFENADNYKILNEVAHRHILAYSRKWLKEQEENNCEFAIIDAPLLFESGFDKECDFIIGIISDDGTRLDRLGVRDNASKDVLEQRLSKQHDDAFYIENCDFIIKNGKNEGENLDLQIASVLNEIRNKG